MNKLLRMISEVPDNIQNSIIKLFPDGSNIRIKGIGKGVDPEDLATMQNIADVGSANATILPYSSVITFPSHNNVMALTILTGAVDFTLTGTTKSVGATTTLRIIGNGTNTPTFTGMYAIPNSATFDATDGVLNYIQFYWDGLACSYNIWKSSALPFTFNPESVPSLTWSRLSNTTVDAN